MTISAEIGKPLHITLTPDLVSVFNTVKSYTTIITDSTHTHAPISANTETSVKLPSYTETPINLKLSTSQCLIEIGISKFQHPKRRKSVSDSYPYLVEKGVVLSWSGLNGRFPETGDSSRFALTNKGVLSASGVQLHLVVEQSELPCLCNSHLDVKLYHHAPLSDLDHSEFFITLSSSSLHLLVSNDHIVAANELHTTLTEVLESLHIDNTAAIDYDAINKESKGNTIYEDDLRSGEFVYVFNAGEGSYQEPLPGQIVFNEGKDAVVASSMEWCYHEPRVITSLQVAPVPFNVSSNQAAAMEIQVSVSYVHAHTHTRTHAHTHTHRGTHYIQTADIHWYTYAVTLYTCVHVYMHTCLHKLALVTVTCFYRSAACYNTGTLKNKSMSR